jgi:hypothetical protein
MGITHRFIEWVAERFRVPPLAIRMFRAVGEVSGLDRSTLPTELVPLNSVQLARGLLNYTVFQGSPSWLYPYWARRQYDPSDPAFVPRSHLGLSVNVTHRNWTGVGNPACPVEPVVDERGLTTPFRDGWSIDVWLAEADRTMFPSALDDVRQMLVADLPIVETIFASQRVCVETFVWTAGSRLIVRAVVRNVSTTRVSCRIALAVRPFNPEGVAPLHSLHADRDSATMTLDGGTRLEFFPTPDAFVLSNHRDGDTAELFRRGTPTGTGPSVTCAKGLANGYAELRMELEPDAMREFMCSLALDHDRAAARSGGSLEAARDRWEALLAAGAAVTTPDSALDAICRSSLATLLMLCDGDVITPGPFTYHHFWFRDAAFMIRALDAWGFTAMTAPIIAGFPRHQEPSGFFRSQQGEWDSNGQAIWTAWQHLLLSGDRQAVTSILPELERGVRWIERMSVRAKERRPPMCGGLLPAGMSAEHLGLSDHYFWDNFWSLAGVEGYVRLCGILGREAEATRARGLAEEYRRVIERAVLESGRHAAIKGIPAAPGRHADSGMIGSCCAWYPLQIFGPGDPRLTPTLSAIEEVSGYEGMFFQHFIHSGMNSYLSLQLAHIRLLTGDRATFWEGLQRVLSYCSPTGTLPEAIHPRTRGGSMGDGHHGWAAAEILLAVRDAIVYEEWSRPDGPHDLVVLGGIPPEWCRPGRALTFERAPVAGGMFSLRMTMESGGLSIHFRLEPNGTPLPREVVLKLPVAGTIDPSGTGPVLAAGSDAGGTVIRLPGGAGDHKLRLTLL